MLVRISKSPKKRLLIGGFVQKRVYKAMKQRKAVLTFERQLSDHPLVIFRITKQKLNPLLIVGSLRCDTFSTNRTNAIVIKVKGALEVLPYRAVRS